MIYLDNKTEQQDFYIPRTDANVSYSPRTYQEGYEDGIEHQKELLASTAFTENGLYTREDGWNEVDVSVPAPALEEKTVVVSADTTNIVPSSGYYGMSAVTIDAADYAQESYDDGFDDGFIDGMSSGYTDGYNSGYTSGETDGFNSGYTSGYTSGSTDGYNSGYTSGYTSGHTDGVDEEKAKMSAVTFTANTAVTLSDGSYSAITVNVPQSGGSGTTVIFPADYIHSRTISSNNHNCRIDTGIYPTTETMFKVKGRHKGKEQNSIVVGYSEDDKADYRLFFAGSGGRTIFFDFNNSRINTNMYSFVDGYEIDLECGNYYVQSGDGTTILTGSQQSTIYDPHTILVDAGSWWLKSLEIWDGNTKVFDGIAAYDENGNIGLYDSVSKRLLTPTNSAISMTYEIVSTQLSSITITANTAITSSSVAYTGITVNVPQVTLGTKLITVNGTYSASTDNLGGYSAITVNVPQSGSPSGISLVDSIHTQSMEWDATKCIDTMITATTETTMRIGYVGAGIGSDRVIGYDWMDTGVYDQGWRYFNGYSNTNTVDFLESRKQGGYPTNQIGIEYDITLGNNYLYDNINESYLVSQGDVKTSLPVQHSILVDVGSQKVKFVEIKDNGVTVFDGQAAIDSDGNIGLYDSISQSMVYNSCLTMAYEGTPTPIPSPDYESGYTSGYTDGYTSGYTSGTTDGENNIISTFSSMTATTNGVYGSSANPLSSITVNVSGSQTVISLVDNVHTQTMSDMSSDYIVTGIYPTTATTMRIKYQGCGLCPSDKIVGFAPNEPEYSGVTDSNDYRYAIHIGDKETLLWDYNWSRLELHNWNTGYLNPIESGVDFDLRFGNNYMYNELTQAYLITGSTQSSQLTTDVPIMVNVSTIKVKSLEIWQGDEKVFDGQAACDSQGNIGLYDSISKELVYNNSLTMAYEGTPVPIPSADYQSGYTDGYASGYTDGSDSIAPLIDRSITNVVIPNGVTKIGASAFADCASLTAVTLHSGVTKIDFDAFQGSHIKSIVIPDSVTSVMDEAFLLCSNLTDVTLSNSMTELNPSVFKHCTSLPSISIPSSITTIFDEVFYGCNSLNIIYCYATTAPSINNIGQTEDTFSGINRNGTIHYPAGSDYSSWQNDSHLSGWTFVADL